MDQSINLYLIVSNVIIFGHLLSILALFAQDYNDSMHANPNVRNHYWLEFCKHETQHRYDSTMKGFEMGKIDSVPVTDNFASNVNKWDVGSPIKIAGALKSQDFSKKSNFPARSVFGNDFKTSTVRLPIEQREFHNLSNQTFKQGKSMNRFRSS